MTETPTAADALEDIQDVCYRAIHHAAFNTSDKMVAALVPLIDRAKAAELRRIADDMDDDAARIKRSLPEDSAFYSRNDRADLGRVIQGEDDASMLRRRADALDPPARQDD